MCRASQCFRLPWSAARRQTRRGGLGTAGGDFQGSAETPRRSLCSKVVIKAKVLNKSESSDSEGRDPKCLLRDQPSESSTQKLLFATHCPNKFSFAYLFAEIIRRVINNRHLGINLSDHMRRGPG